jgi:hypothetical protein
MGGRGKRAAKKGSVKVKSRGIWQIADMKKAQSFDWAS